MESPAPPCAAVSGAVFSSIHQLASVYLWCRLVSPCVAKYGGKMYLILEIMAFRKFAVVALLTNIALRWSAELGDAWITNVSA